MTDIDTTAADMLTQLDRELTEDGIELAFAELKDAVRRKISTYDADWLTRDDRFYPTVSAAVICESLAEAGRAVGGQHVRAAGQVVTEAGRAPRPAEHGAGVADQLQEGVRVSDERPYELRLRVAGRAQSPEEAAIIGEEVEALYTNGPAGGAAMRRCGPPRW
jgi:hypothetical protein